MTDYVAGFMYTRDRKYVLLVRKLKPDWQAGKLNAVGGKVEDGESFLEAMHREFSEETTETTKRHWECFCLLHRAQNTVRFYRAFSNMHEGLPFLNDTGEELIKASVRNLPPNLIDNLPWLLFLGLDDGISKPVIVLDNTEPWDK